MDAIQYLEVREASRLLNSVKVGFNQPSEIEHRMLEVDDGLTDSEQRMMRYLSPRSCVLDIGCAVGRASIALAQAGHIVTGVDVAGRLIEKAQQIATEKKIDTVFRVCKPLSLPFPDAAFDAAILLKTFCYVPRRQNRVKWLTEIARVVRPKGWLFLSQYILDGILDSYDEVRDEKHNRFAIDYETLEEGDGFTLARNENDHSHYLHFFMKADLLLELRSSPFQIIKSFREETLCYMTLQK